jgi:hypothetical protein
MAEYTYRFADLLSDSDVAELELSNVRFDRRIITPGAFSASITVTNTDLADQVKKIVPAKTVVHVYRDADIWGTYIIWQKRVRSSSRQGVQVEFTGASLESYFYRRLLDLDSEYDDTDQFDIARDLLTIGQTGWMPYPNAAQLGIISNPFVTSGVLRDRSYYVTDGATVGQRLEELANVDNGFEYMINTYVDNDAGYRVREFVIATELGSENIDVAFSYPGTIDSYEIQYEATEAATAFWTRGDSIQDDVTADARALMTLEPALAEDWLEAGYPHLDKVIDYSTVIELTTLEAYADWWRDNRAGVFAIPIISINTTDVATLITPSSLGTSAHFTILDEYFTLVNGVPEFSSIHRIVGIEVTPPQRGSSETIRFVIASDVDPTEMGA